MAILSMAVTYDVLVPRFGAWAAPTVGALDALWVVVQATEILAGNNSRRAKRVRAAGLFLTAVTAAIPTADLVVSGHGGDLAVVLTPVAIVATKTAWWFVLPSLGRRVSDTTRQTIATTRQSVADRLEVMEAEAADRIELLEVATRLEKQVAEAERGYRAEVLKIQQKTAEKLHEQAQTTEKTLTDKPLPLAVAAIALPELGGQWEPGGLALPVGRDGFGTADDPDGTGRHADDTQVTGSSPGQPSRPSAPGVTPAGTGDDTAETGVTLAMLASVAGVPVPEPVERLTDVQMGVVLRYLRYADDPPLSYRQAVTKFREAGFVGSEERVRRVWGTVLSQEESTGSDREADDEDTAAATEDAAEDDEEPADATT
ncbi:hypothetical protein [Streptomyces sp. NPDC017941]|uniref:hypothetical protein n=1 Tax=unclassified Streptomyces TaxID=2593676 RepID=UPI0037988C5E